MRLLFRFPILLALLYVPIWGCANDSGVPFVTGGTGGDGGVGGAAGVGGMGGVIVSDSICGGVTAPDGCGVNCSSDAQCSQDTFCLNGECDAFCADAATDCDAGQMCTRGRCVTMNTGALGEQVAQAELAEALT
ncbi:MAG: hypothetical protein R3A47_10575 [Polyangiales bacterium]